MVFQIIGTRLIPNLIVRAVLLFLFPSSYLLQKIGCRKIRPCFPRQGSHRPDPGYRRFPVSGDRGIRNKFHNSRSPEDFCHDRGGDGHSPLPAEEAFKLQIRRRHRGVCDLDRRNSQILSPEDR